MSATSGDAARGIALAYGGDNAAGTKEAAVQETPQPAPQDPAPEAVEEAPEEVLEEEVVDAAPDEVPEEEVQDPEAEAGEEPTDEAEAPEEDDAVPEWWYEGPTSRYRTPEEARRGIEEKDKYIDDLKSEVKNLRQFKAQAEMYESYLDQDRLVRVAVDRHLPDEYKGRTESDFEDPDELRKFIRAYESARFKVDQEQETLSRRQEEEQAEMERRYKDAQKHLAEIITPDYFETHNVEDKRRLAKLLDESAEGSQYSPLEVAQHLEAVLGPKEAERYIRGLRDEFWDGRRTKVAQKVKQQVDVRPRKVAVEKPKPKPQPKTAKERISFAYRQKPR